jgi:hypothetical protein
MHVRLIAVCLVLAGTTLLAGCGAQEFGSPGETKNFISSVARGGKIGDWKLADSAGENAIRAWSLASKIQALGEKLREKDFPGACEIAEDAENAHKVIEGAHVVLTIEDHERILAAAVRGGANPNAVDALINEVLALDVWERIKTITAVCGVAKAL